MKRKKASSEPPRDVIDPREWRAIGQLRHGGITYGSAEPLPVLTIAEAELYEKQGTLMRISADTTAESYVDGPDEVILQLVLDRKPEVAVLEKMLMLVRRNSRSKVLELALTIAVQGAPGAARPLR